MKRFMLTSMMTLPMLLAFPLTHLAVGEPSAESETVELFNCDDFDGLYVYVSDASIDPADVWKVEDGLLRCTGVGRGLVRTYKAYADYKLQFDWCWPEAPGNSGVILNQVGDDLTWPKSFEAQLKSGRAGDFYSFFDARSNEERVGRNPRGVSTGRLPRSGPSAENPVGEWNTFEIIVEGDSITLYINGTQVNRMTGILPSAGMIGLQAEGHPIDFRNVTLTPLPPAKDLNAPMPQ